MDLAMSSHLALVSLSRFGDWTRWMMLTIAATSWRQLFQVKSLWSVWYLMWSMSITSSRLPREPARSWMPSRISHSTRRTRT